MRKPQTRETNYLECSFCSRKQAEVGKLIAGPDCFICDTCISDASQTISQGELTEAMTISVEKQGDARCSFCGQQPNIVVGMVGVPEPFICNQCVKICEEILERDNDCQGPTT